MAGDLFDDPNREAVGLPPAGTGAGDTPPAKGKGKGKGAAAPSSPGDAAPAKDRAED